LSPRDVDHLLVLGVQRADGQEAVLGELATHRQELAVGRLGLDMRGVDVARLVVHVDAVDHVLGVLVAGVELDGGVHVPLDDLAVQEQRGVGVAAAVEGGVQGPRPSSTSATMALVEVFQLAVEPVEHLGQFDDGAGGRELAGADEVLAVGLAFTPCGFLGTAHVGGQGGLGVLVGFLGAVDHGHLGCRRWW
jgi:hypothetical protein